MTDQRRGFLHDKVPVETLDEVRLARIEKRLLAESALQRGGDESAVPVRRFRGWAWPAYAVVATAAVVLLWLRPIANSPAPSSQDIVVRPGQSGAAIVLAGSTVTPDEGGDLTIREGSDGSTEITLRAGRIDCEVEPRRQRPPFVVRAGKTTVTVVGTAFSVTRDGDGAIVEVVHGVVTVEHGTDDTRVRADERWTPSKGVTPLRSEPAVVATLPVANPKESESTVDADAASTTADDDQPVLARKTAGTMGQRPTAAPSTSSIRRSGTTQAPATDEPVSFSPYRRPPGLDPIWDAGSSSPKEVESQYRQRSLVRGDSDAAAYALYSLAYWQLYRLRKPREAIKAAERYESRFRRGEHSESVLWVRIAALCAAGEHSRCRAAAHSYLRKYPGGRFARSAKRVIDANH